MYINLHTKVKFSKKKKIGIFCNNIITFSSRAHLMKKSTFLPKFHIFCTILTYLQQIDIDRNTCHFASKFALHYFITLLRNSVICPKTDAFYIKCYFLLKQNKLTLFKNRKHSFKNT